MPGFDGTQGRVPWNPAGSPLGSKEPSGKAAGFEEPRCAGFTEPRVGFHGTQLIRRCVPWNPAPGFLGTQPGQACWVRKEPSTWVVSKEPKPAGFRGKREGKGEGERKKKKKR
ncbi:hypothetical protein SLEP1_g40077 [Rubroshorea leprosula]|uniref:Uncharacterized protein n=1 Tax=Rubroshorea leprosula TaxID=152421 RepID=A0AAV5L2N0_9ROSI|nr:hypothetical protein SLEP1_g40077 [Rubroshorea leprosula]